MLHEIIPFIIKCLSINIYSINGFINWEIILKDSIIGYNAWFNIRNKNSNINGFYINKLLIIWED